MIAYVDAHTGVFDRTGVTAKLYAIGADAPTGDPIDCTSMTTPGLYRFVNESLTGEYRVDLISSGQTRPFWTGFAVLATTGLVVCSDDPLTPTLTDDLLTAIQGYLFGTGSCVMTVTVKDTDGAPLQGVKLSARLNGQKVSFALTDQYGVGQLMIDPGNYSVIGSLPGFNGFSASLVVTADDDIDYEMTRLAITPSEPGFVTGYLVCTKWGLPLEGESHTVWTKEPPADGVGQSLESDKRIVLSDAEGKVEFPGLTPGARYWWQSGDRDPVAFTAGTADPFRIKSVVRGAS